MYQFYTLKLTNTLAVKTVLQAIWAVTMPHKAQLMQQYCRSAKGPMQSCIKVAGGHFEHAVWIDVISVNMAFFLYNN